MNNSEKLLRELKYKHPELRLSLGQELDLMYLVEELIEGKEKNEEAEFNRGYEEGYEEGKDSVA